MKKNLVLPGIILLLLLGISMPGMSQETKDRVEDVYKQAERIYSTDDLLVNGQFYLASRPKAKGSPYFGDNIFTDGSIIIKGRKFDKVLLKFNIEDQRLILREALESGKYVTIILNSDLVKQFNIGSMEFVNFKNYFNSSSNFGFFALVYKGGFSFLIHYEKQFRAVYDNQTPHGSYSDMRVKYYIYRDDQLEEVSKKKALLQYFIEHKNEVKSYLRKQKIKYNKATASELNLLMKYCDSISSNK